MTEEKFECNDNCDCCEEECEELLLDESELLTALMGMCAEMNLHEFAPMMRGIISMFADVHGISIGKVLDAMLLETYYDDDPHWEREHSDIGASITS